MLSFFPRDVLDEIGDLIESVSEGFPSYFCFLSKNNPKNLDPSYKTDLDFWDSCGRVNLPFIIEEIR